MRYFTWKLGLVSHVLWMVVDSSIQHDDERLHLNRYKLATAYNPNNDKGDGVGIYFKEFLATSQMELNNLNECIILHPK